MNSQVFMLKYAIQWIKIGDSVGGYEVQGKNFFFQFLLKYFVHVSNALEHLISSKIQCA